ncbi:MAG: RNA polymerase sigma-70 factor [Bacteroidota bacterium]
MIQSLKDGDERAYTFLVDRYHHDLCVYANSLVNDRGVAEDIVQNVFIRTWERRKNLNPSYSLKSFLYKAAYNEFIDQYRKRKSVMAIEKIYIQELDRTVTRDDAFFEKLVVRLQQEIQNLPPTCKDIFLMSKREGLSNMEIAEYLDVSKKTIEYHMTRAFSILRKRISNDIEPILFLLFSRPALKKGS